MMIYSYDDEKPNIDKSCYIAPSADIIGKVNIAKDSSVWFGCVLRGDVHNIKIGERTNIQDMSMVHVTDGKFNTTIGSDVTIGHKALLHGCKIEDNVLIGMGAVIMDDSVISKNSIVAAGSLVAPGKSFPEGVLIMGRPAKVIRKLSQEEISSIEESAIKYAKLASKYTSSKSVKKITL